MVNLVRRVARNPLGAVNRVAPVLRVGTVLPLKRIIQLYGRTDKLSHGYDRYYVRHLSSRRLSAMRVLEIGVGGYKRPRPGGSLAVWRDYLSRSRIVGLDISDKNVRLGRRVGFVRGDQADPAALNQVIEALGGPPDLVVDDGSHLDTHAWASFRHLFPLMPPGSVYVVEDLHTSYWESFGGSIPAKGSTAIGLAKVLVDDVQAGDVTYVQHPGWGPRPPIDTAGVAEVHVYPGILFVIKSETAAS